MLDARFAPAMPETLKCDRALLDKDLSGRVYIVTGASSGVGLAITEQLVRQGADVVAACRRIDAAREATRHLEGERGSVEVMELDLAKLHSVRNFVGSFFVDRTVLHGLVNNAGVMNTPQGRTEDGFETQFGVNFLGHFLLTELMLGALRAGAPSRVVCVSSVAHVGYRGRPAHLHLDDPFFEHRPYDGVEAYNQSKLALVIYARHLAKRMQGTGLSAFSTHPGWVATKLVQHTAPPWVQNVLLRPLWGLLGIVTPEEGAQTELHCLLDENAPQHSGAYFSQHSILYPNREDRAGGWPMRSPNPQVYDDALAQRLYEDCLALVNLPPQRPVFGPHTGPRH